MHLSLVQKHMDNCNLVLNPFKLIMHGKCLNKLSGDVVDLCVDELYYIGCLRIKYTCICRSMLVYSVSQKSSCSC